MPLDRAVCITRSGRKIFMDLGECQMPPAKKSKCVVRIPKIPSSTTDTSYCRQRRRMQHHKRQPKTVPALELQSDSSHSDLLVRRKSVETVADIHQAMVQPPQTDRPQIDIAIMSQSTTTNTSTAGIRLNFDFTDQTATQTQNPLSVDAGASGDGQASKCSCTLVHGILRQALQESLNKMINSSITTNADKPSGDQSDNSNDKRVQDSSTQTVDPTVVQQTSDFLAEQLANMASELQPVEICQCCRYANLLLQLNGDVPLADPNNELCMHPNMMQLSSPLSLLQRGWLAASSNTRIAQGILLLLAVLLFAFICTRFDIPGGLRHLNNQILRSSAPVKRTWLRRILSKY